LSADIYYQRVFHEMRHADSNSKVLAVSTLTSELWTRDTDQTHYAALNLEAARRGAEIQRLFVVPEAQIGSFEEIIQHQFEAGISIRVCSTALLAHVPDLADFVLFEAHGDARGYVAEPSIVGTRPIRSGSLILTEHEITRKREAFAAAWELSSQTDAFFLAHRSTAGADAHFPAPGLGLEVFHVDSPVVTCEEAAAARNIPLARELKTLLLQTSDRGIVAVHLPGDGRLSLRKVRTLLETATAYLTDPDELSRLGLSPGTVCAILDPVWSMTHLISVRLLKMDMVTTNNGTLTGYFKFKPTILAQALDPIVDDFEE
jgi:prolyl-tRNA editing enzyme YbaK/EbsC (Cys-tRNA(Pro) deacylase)